MGTPIGRRGLGSLPRRRLAAFTLLELLVVIVIIGVLAGMVVLGSFGMSKERDLRTEAERLALLVELARDQSLQRNESWGMHVRPDGYEFVTYDAVEQAWVEVEAKPFQARNTTLTVQLSSKIEQFEQLIGETHEERAALPQIFIFANGEQSPFEITVTPSWESTPWVVYSDGLSRTSARRLPEHRAQLAELARVAARR